MAWEVLLRQDQQTLFSSATQQYQVQKELEQPIAYLASSNPDVMHYHQAKHADNSNQFVLAMEKEINDHEKYEHFIPALKEKVPKDNRI